MPTASMFDDPVRERGRLGSIIASMGDGTGKPTERVANPYLVTDAAEPNAILRMRDDDTRALDESGDSSARVKLSRGQFERGSNQAMRQTFAIPLTESRRNMSDLSRSDLILTVMKETKQCASCGRGSHLQYAYGHWLKWRRCRRHLTLDEKAVLILKLMEAEAGGLTN